MNKPKISVIVACYNCENSIEKCLDSIINQSFRDVEVIVVNDGSVDNSLKIIEEFGKKDARIRIFSQENKGVSAVRNFALSKAVSEYITFVDSDDWLSEDYCEILYKLAVENNAGISVGRFYFKKGDDVSEEYCDGRKEILNRKEALEYIFLDDYIKNYPWAKLYKRTLFDGIKFPENKVAFEDLSTLYKVFEKANKVVLYNYPIYWYVYNENSLSNDMTAIKNYNYFKTVIDLHIDSKKILGDDWNMSFLQFNYIKILKGVRRIFLQEDDVNSDINRKMYEEVRSFYKKERSSIPFFIRLKYLFYLSFPRVYKNYYYLKSLRG